jgi:putative hemolysin
VALNLANSPNKFLSTVQIGITLIGILTGIYSGDKITTDGDLHCGLCNINALCTFCCGNYRGCLSLVGFRELLPKRIGLNHPEAIAKAFAMPMKMVSVVTAPFIWLLTNSTEFY